MKHLAEGGSVTMTLWILFCRMTEKMDMLFTFYAIDHERAEQKAGEILKKYPYEPRHPMTTTRVVTTIYEEIGLQRRRI